MQMFPKISPIIPERRPGIFEHRDWLYEIKYDGFRALAYLDDGRCRFVSRKGNEMKRFEQLSSAIGKVLKVKSAVIDGEIVALNESGLPAFYQLMRRKCHAVYYAFERFVAGWKGSSRAAFNRAQEHPSLNPSSKIVLDWLRQFHWPRASEGTFRVGESER
jgi:hypothetical protein